MSKINIKMGMFNYCVNKWHNITISRSDLFWFTYGTPSLTENIKKIIPLNNIDDIIISDVSAL